MKLQIKSLNLPVHGNGKILIAGPCSAETEVQTMKTAELLNKIGCRIYRAGAWKPRTKPSQFEGNGEEALKWMRNVKKEYGMMLATEVATPVHVELALKYGIDILWIGARTSSDPFAVESISQALQGCDVPVLIKNPINPDIELWIGAIERINKAGITRIGAIHRGFSVYEKSMFRNLPIWQIPIELRRRCPGLPLLCDPSHICGRRDIILPVIQQATDIGVDGFIIESHHSPDEAITDAKQQLTPDSLNSMISKVIEKSESIESEELQHMREYIDILDKQWIHTLAERFSVCAKIGEHKKEKGCIVLQNERYSEVTNNCIRIAKERGVNTNLIQKIIELVHTESVRLQTNSNI